MAAGNPYLEFREWGPPPGQKTVRYVVLSALHGDRLGEIKWFGRWRQYTFWPEAGATFNPDCLDSINTFIRGLMASRRTHLKGKQTP